MVYQSRFWYLIFSIFNIFFYVRIILDTMILTHQYSFFFSIWLMICIFISIFILFLGSFMILLFLIFFSFLSRLTFIILTFLTSFTIFFFWRRGWRWWRASIISLFQHVFWLFILFAFFFKLLNGFALSISFNSLVYAPKAISPSKLGHNIFSLRNIIQSTKGCGQRLYTGKLKRLPIIYWITSHYVRENSLYDY